MFKSVASTHQNSAPERSGAASEGDDARCLARGFIASGRIFSSATTHISLPQRGAGHEFDRLILYKPDILKMQKFILKIVSCMQWSTAI
jgi:hypothetical protein